MDKLRLVFASGNAGKLSEVSGVLPQFDVIPQAQLSIPEVPETGLTFVENALIKARNACEHSGLPSLADDSGLEVDALNGQPGIHSARYSGGDSQANIEKLLLALSGVKNRSARFQCVLVFMRHALDPTPILCHGTWEGLILGAPEGDGGFGYDPVFYAPAFGCSAASLTRDQKNQVSHRAQALRQLQKQLSNG
jgi:XTP/dITP diphosphohydrolase